MEHHHNALFPGQKCRVQYTPGIRVFPKDISSAAAFQHTLCNSVMFVFIAVFFQVWAMFVPFKMCPHLVANIRKVRIDGKIVFSIVIHNGTDAFGLSFNRVHHAQFINYPGERWFPIAAFINALQCLVGGHRVAEFSPPTRVIGSLNSA